LDFKLKILQVYYGSAYVKFFLLGIAPANRIIYGKDDAKIKASFKRIDSNCFLCLHVADGFVVDFSARSIN